MRELQRSLATDTNMLSICVGMSGKRVTTKRMFVSTNLRHFTACVEVGFAVNDLLECLLVIPVNSLIRRILLEKRIESGIQNKERRILIDIENTARVQRQ